MRDLAMHPGSLQERLSDIGATWIMLAGSDSPYRLHDNPRAAKLVDEIARDLTGVGPAEIDRFDNPLERSTMTMTDEAAQELIGKVFLVMQFIDEPNMRTL